MKMFVDPTIKVSSSAYELPIERSVSIQKFIIIFINFIYTYYTQLIVVSFWLFN